MGRHGEIDVTGGVLEDSDVMELVKLPNMPCHHVFY